jgi:ubiquinone/menaquinone biosynthesis C-methylase UbiE
MSEANAVAAHYTRPQLEQAILGAIRRSGIAQEKVTAADLAPMDEFHIGGIESTKAFAEFMKLRPGMELLDVGCGVGGPARYFAGEKNCRVTGIDLTDEFVRAAVSLTKMVHLESAATFQHGSALAMPFDDGSFDGAYMIHVGMNVSDKHRLFREVARVLKAGARFTIFDLTRVGERAFAFPVPWAMSEETSFVTDAKTYKEWLRAAGFEFEHERGRGEFGIEFTEKVLARVAQGGPPALGLHLLMGDKALAMVKNVLGAMKAGILEPIEIVAVKK